MADTGARWRVALVGALTAPGSTLVLAAIVVAGIGAVRMFRGSLASRTAFDMALAVAVLLVLAAWFARRGAAARSDAPAS